VLAVGNGEGSIRLTTNHAITIHGLLKLLKLLKPLKQGKRASIGGTCTCTIHVLRMYLSDSVIPFLRTREKTKGRKTMHRPRSQVPSLLFFARKLSAASLNFRIAAPSPLQRVRWEILVLGGYHCLGTACACDRMGKNTASDVKMEGRRKESDHPTSQYSVGPSIIADMQTVPPPYQLCRRADPEYNCQRPYVLNSLVPISKLCFTLRIHTSSGVFLAMLAPCISESCVE
jgi:hypothetical protein